MLEEIFQKLSEEITEAGRPVVKKLKLHFGKERSAPKTGAVRMELMNFSPDFSVTSFTPVPAPSPSLYGFCFYIIPFHTDYLKLLKLTELICDHFEKKPFIQWSAGEKEYEMAISSLEVSLDTLNHFWQAQKEPHRPVLFYKVRVSDI